MQCPRCGRNLLALARRPSTWGSNADRGTWIGLHFGDTQGTSSCKLQHEEALGLSPAPAQPAVARAA
jgi:hypothetical protein